STASSTARSSPPARPPCPITWVAATPPPPRSKPRWGPRPCGSTSATASTLSRSRRRRWSLSARCSPPTFEKRKDRNVNYPAFVQMRLDGVRALAYQDGDRVEIISCSGKSWRDSGTAEHIAKALERNMPCELFFEGEIYAHGGTY